MRSEWRRRAPRCRRARRTGAQLTRTRRRHGCPSGCCGHGEIATWIPARSRAACTGSSSVPSGRGSVVGGSGTLTMAPTISSGAADRSPTASARRSRAASAKPVAAFAERGPATGNEAVAERDGGRHAQPRSGIERAGPVVLEPEPASIGSRRRRPVADDDRPHQLLAIPTDVEERAALRRAHPLVAVADRVGGADRVEVDVHHARGVCAVDERVDPAVVERGHDLRHRQHERRRARDVVHHHEPRSWADGREDGVARHLGRARPERGGARSPAGRRPHRPSPGARCGRRGRRGRAGRSRRRGRGAGCARRC